MQNMKLVLVSDRHETVPIVTRQGVEFVPDVLKFKEEFKRDFIEYPPNNIEEEIDNMPKKGKLLKQLNEAKPAFDKIWKQSLKVSEVLGQFNYLYFSVFTNDGMRSLMKQYAALQYEMKELDKYVKGVKNIPMVVDYYKNHLEALKVNVFDMMREDLNALEPFVENRRKEANEEYDWDFESIGFELLLPEYKEFLNTYKEDQQKKGK